MNLTIRDIFRCFLKQLASFYLFVPSPSCFIESTVPLLRKLICNFMVGLSAQSKYEPSMYENKQNKKIYDFKKFRNKRALR